MSVRIDNGIELCWGTPIYLADLKGFDLGNVILQDYISSNLKSFHSLNLVKPEESSLSNLDNWNIKESRELKSLVLKSFNELMQALLTEYDEKIQVNLMCSFAGSGIYNKTLQIKKKKSAWIALYFINIDENKNFESKISFLDPRHGAGMVFDGFDVFGTSRELNLSNEKLLFFPSWLIPSDQSDIYSNDLFYIQFEFLFPSLT